MTGPRAPTLSVIVPATDTPPTLRECLRAIDAADEPADEVIAVEHASRRGPAAARNEGAAQAGGEVLVFVDADVLPHRDAFRRIRAAFGADPALVAVFGSYDAEPRARGVVSRFRNLLHHHVHQEGGGAATTFWAGLGAVRRDAFECAGGFDAERFLHPSVEDIELGMRLAAAGARLRLDPELQGTHLKAWTLVEMLRVDTVRRAYPWTRLLLERGGSTALNLGWRHRASAAASVVCVAAVARTRAELSLAAAGTLVAANRSFYALLLRRYGPAEAAAGVGLHALHHLAGVAGATAGLVAHVLDGRRSTGAADGYNWTGR